MQPDDARSMSIAGHCSPLQQKIPTRPYLFLAIPILQRLCRCSIRYLVPPLARDPPPPRWILHIFKHMPKHPVVRVVRDCQDLP